MDMFQTESILYGVWHPTIFWVYCAIIILMLQVGKYSIPDNSNIHVEFPKIHVVHILLSGTENKA